MEGDYGRPLIPLTDARSPSPPRWLRRSRTAGAPRLAQRFCRGKLCARLPSAIAFKPSPCNRRASSPGKTRNGPANPVEQGRTISSQRGAVPQRENARSSSRSRTQRVQVPGIRSQAGRTFRRPAGSESSERCFVVEPAHRQAVCYHPNVAAQSGAIGNPARSACRLPQGQRGPGTVELPEFKVRSVRAVHRKNVPIAPAGVSD